MASTLLQLRRKVRTRLKDWPDACTIDTAITSETAVDIEIDYAERLKRGGVLKIGSELMLIRTITPDSGVAGACTVRVMRGYEETTAATHLIDAAVAIYDIWTDEEINGYINDAIVDVYPDLYRRIEDATLETDEDTRIYDISGLSIAIDILAMVEIQDENDNWQVNRDWYLQGDNLLFTKDFTEDSLSIKLIYQARFTALSLDATETDVPLEEALLLYTCARATDRRLHERGRFDEAATETEPDAATPGDIVGITGYEMYQYREYLEKHRMQPLPRYRARYKR